MTLYFLTLKNKISKFNFFQTLKEKMLYVSSFPFRIKIWNYINEFVNLSFNIMKTQKMGLSEIESSDDS